MVRSDLYAMTTAKQIFVNDDGTRVPIKDYIDMRFDASERAIELSERTIQARLAGLNEWRQQSLDQTRTYVTRTELEAKLGGRRDTLALGVGAIGVITGVISLIVGLL
ncbi:MAG: hypothetical protein KKD01_20035 [Proteobacteria bacterium]|nr:hypothetical protein [Pseudomonadota bacterium]